MSELVEHAIELMRPWASVSSRRMFGGHDLYRDGLMFALEAYETLYMKVDDITKPAFSEAGCTPFVYEGAGRRVQMSYWTVPPQALESPSEMLRWCVLGWQAALRAQDAKAGARHKATAKVAPRASRTKRA